MPFRYVASRCVVSLRPTRTFNLDASNICNIKVKWQQIWFSPVFLFHLQKQWGGCVVIFLSHFFLPQKNIMMQKHVLSPQIPKKSSKNFFAKKFFKRRHKNIAHIIEFSLVVLKENLRPSLPRIFHVLQMAELWSVLMLLVHLSQNIQF